MKSTYKQPKLFMKDINEVEQSLELPQDTGSADDLTIGELIKGHEEDVIGSEAMLSQYDLAENEKMIQDMVKEHESMAPEVKEFMGSEKFTTSSGEAGLAGSVEKAEGPSYSSPTDIKTMLDRMKVLSNINTEKPDSQWDYGTNSSLTDAPTEVAPDVIKRSESSTGAPTIQTLKNPEAVSSGSSEGSAEKTSKQSDDSDTPKKENPFAKKEKAEPMTDQVKPKEGGDTPKKENPFAKKEKAEPKAEAKDADDKDEDKKIEEAINEVTTHHIGAAQRNVAGNDAELVHEEEEVGEEDCDAEDNDEAILKSESTEALYEAMNYARNDPDRFMTFKRKFDEVSASQRLQEAVNKMRMRF